MLKWPFKKVAGISKSEAMQETDEQTDNQNNQHLYICCREMLTGDIHVLCPSTL